MDEQTEQTTDFKSLRETFQKKTSCARPSDSSHFPPTKTEGPIIHNIRSNPAIRTVIDALEDHKTTPFRLSEKPKVPLKPKAFPGAGPKVPHKDQRSKADLEDQSMKLNKPFRRTLSITDPSRREADGVSSNALQLYNRLSLSNDIKTDFTCSSPKKQMPPQEFYETFEPGPPVMAEKDRLHGSSPPPPPRVQLGPSIPSPVNHAVADEHYKFVASAISKELLLIPRCNRHSHHDASPPVVDQTEEEGLYVTSDQFEVFKEVHENRSSSYDSDSSPASDILLPFEIKSDSNPRDQSGGNVDNSPHGERRKSALLPEKKVSGLNNAPVLRPLSSYNLLGPKPPKPARPPTVDLQKFLKKLQEERNLTVGCSGPPQKIGEIEEQEEVYEVTNIPPAPDDEQYCYEGPLRELIETIESFSEVDAGPLDNSYDQPDFRSEVADGYKQPSYKNSHCEGIPLAETNPVALPMGAKCAKIGKRELALRKKFQITGSENAVYKMSVKEDCKGGKDMLTLRKGELVEIINTTDCPPGKWLARNDNGNYGFIPVSVIDAYQDLLILGRPYLRQNFIQSDVYIEVESGKTASDDSLTTTSNYSEDLDNVYDDAGSNHSTVSNSSGRLPKILTNFLKKDAKKRNDSGFVSPTSVNDSAPTEEFYFSAINEEPKEDAQKSNLRQIFQNSKKPKTDNLESDRKMLKIFAKEEKIFRDKFKYTSDIVVSTTAVVNEFTSAPPKGKLNLPVKPGERLDVIDVSSENMIICRNSQGKFGYVQIECLNFESRECK